MAAETKTNSANSKKSTPVAGDFIKLDITGTTKSTGKIFETTDADIAKANNMFNPRVRYAPQLIVYQRGQLLPGIETAVSSMAAGDEKEIELPAEKAFGAKDQNNIRVMPLSDFASQKITPVPGMVINMNNYNGLVRSVSGGRVVMDFNHPLAGEAVKYKIKLVSVIKDDAEKITALVDRTGFNAKAKFANGNLELTFAGANTSNEFMGRKKELLEFIAAFVPGVDEIRAIEEYKKMEVKQIEQAAKPASEPAAAASSSKPSSTSSSSSSKKKSQ